MAKLTTATVEYSRTIKPADYESKGAKASFSIVPEDEDSFISLDEVTSALADAKTVVHTAIGLNPAPKAEPAKDAPKRGRPPKTVEERRAEEDKAAELRKELDAKGVTQPKQQVKSDELPDDEETPAPEASDELPDEIPPDEDPLAGWDKKKWEGEANKANNLKLQALKAAGTTDGAAKITKLIKEYNPDKTKMFRIIDLAADRRSEYLKKLEALA